MGFKALVGRGAQATMERAIEMGKGDRDTAALMFDPKQSLVSSWRASQERPLIGQGFESFRRQTAFAAARAWSLNIDVVKDAPGPMRLVDGPCCAERSGRPFRTFAIVFADPVFRPIDLVLNDLHSLRVVAELVL